MLRMGCQHKIHGNAKKKKSHGNRHTKQIEELIQQHWSICDGDKGMKQCTQWRLGIDVYFIDKCYALRFTITSPV
jgi:hypothetical protein